MTVHEVTPARPTGRARRWMPLLLGLLLALAVTACDRADDGEGVASAGGDSTASASPDAEGQADPFAFAQCMRDNGIEDFPDPQARPDEGGSRGGGPARVLAPEGADPEEVQAATEQCRQYLPNGGEAPERSAEEIEQLREFAQCMRDNGVSEFPDPNPEGGNVGAGRDIDPNSPEFQAANEICRDLRPSADGAAPGSGQ